MAENQPKENIQQPAKKKTSRLKVVLIILALLFSLLVLKVILLITAKPTISVDYLAEFNRISKPADYDPNKNATKNYEMAAAEYIEKPDSLTSASIYWPYWIDDINHTELEQLRQWLKQNALAFGHLKKAAEKQYLWTERHTKDNLVANLKLLAPKYPYLSRALQLRVKLKALDGEFDLALQVLLIHWKLATHYTNPELLLTEQFVGMRKKRDTIKIALLILDLCNLDPQTLKTWQQTWQKQFEHDKYIPAFQSEKLMYYERIQICFTDDGRGDGRLIWSAARSLTCPYCTPIWVTFRDWIKGPSRRETTELVDTISNRYERIITKTPWQQHTAPQGNASQKEQKIIKNETFDFFIPDYNSAYYSYYKLKAMQEALVTVIAVLRYKAEWGNYPDNLEQLIQQKYLTKLPQDPFSDGPLIYSLLDDDFELYSVGKDFKDDNAARYPGGSGSPISCLPKGDEVFWPPLSKARKNIKSYRFPEEFLPPLKSLGQ